MSYGPPKGPSRQRQRAAMALTRREFLRASGGVAPAAAAGPARLARRLRRRGGTSAAAWSALGRQLDGALLRPGDLGYGAARLPTNRRYAAVRPAGIA
jgi:hypothetical protein